MGVNAPAASGPAMSSVPSTIGRRFAALLIDAFILGELGNLLAATFGILHVTSGTPLPPGGSGFSTTFTASPSLGQPWELIGFLAYFAFFELLFAGTPGKTVMGLRVASANGAPVSAMAVFKRNLLRPVDYFLLIGALPLLFGGKEQRFGDMWAHTKVLRYSGSGDPAPVKWRSGVKGGVLVSVFVILRLGSALFDWTWRPAIDIQGLQNIGRLHGISPGQGVDYGTPIRNGGDVTYPFRYETSTTRCEGTMTLRWNPSFGLWGDWSVTNSSTSCATKP